MGLFSSGKKGKQDGASAEVNSSVSPNSFSESSDALPSGFSLLVQNLRVKGDRDAMDRLWGAVYNLPEWLFLVHPREWDQERGVWKQDPPRPYMFTYEGKPFLAVFTDFPEAHRFAQENGLLLPEGKALVLSMPFEDAVHFAWQYRERDVHGVYFNSGPDGFYAPLSNLVPMYEWFRKRPPDWAPKTQPAQQVSFDNVVRAYRAMPAEIGVQGLYGEILSLPGWHFVCDKERPRAPHIVMLETGPGILAFSDEAQAIRGADRFGLRNPDGTVNIMQLPTKAVADWLPSFQANGVQSVLFNSGGEAFVMDIVKILSLMKPSQAGHSQPNLE